MLEDSEGESYWRVAGGRWGEKNIQAHKNENAFKMKIA
jgi:hypothetical protein